MSNTSLAPLWAIEQELVALLDTIDVTPEEQLPEIQAEIDRYLGQEAAKTDQIAHVLAAMEWECKCVDDEIERLRVRKTNSILNRARLEKYVCRIIAARSVKKLAGNTNTLSVRISDAVVIRDEAAIPAAYIVEKVVTTKSIDKLEIKRALKAGQDVPGADLEYRDNLQRR